MVPEGKDPAHVFPDIKSSLTQIDMDCVNAEFIGSAHLTNNES